jgi:hypothetical protein
MNKKSYITFQRLIASLTVFAVFAMPIGAQTQIQLHSNKYKVTDDVKVGRQAAAEVEKQFPILNDREATDYVSRVGERLVGSIPPQFQHPEFNYYFKIVNARDINAFALPGGPMYVNRGMIEAARTEGEMAGVMAHELSHVALRHGTAQASKSQKYGTAAGVLGILGQIIGGPAGAAAQIAGQGVGVYFLKFSREYETEADILGAQIMARAGYDPRDLANMFKTIEQQSGGGGGGGFLSDHPSPSNRYARINQEAQYLRIENPVRNSPDFSRIQARLRGMGSAPTMAEIARGGQRYPTGENTGNYPNDYPNNGSLGRVQYPSTRYQTYSTLGGIVRASVPANWRELGGDNSVWFAPEGAYGQYQNQVVYTHGVDFGVAQTQSRNLQQATQEFLNSLGQGNLRQRSGFQRTTVGGRSGMTTTLSNTNEATGQAELVTVVTTQLRNGELFYMIAVAPENEWSSYQAAFRNILRTLQIND